MDVRADLSNFFAVRCYSEQLGIWTSVHIGESSSWSVLVILTFTIIAHPEHIEGKAHVPE